MDIISKVWAFEEANKVLNRVKRNPEKVVLFETGYGPSGLPHIGTFGEVARTTMVMHAFNLIADGNYKTRLVCFSDDMDGMRKVPDNVPNQDMLRLHLNEPLTKVPNPFDSNYSSFGHHNNAKLREFLDRFGFEYEFMSATEVYKSGQFNEKLLLMLEKYEEVMNIMLPTLRDQRRETYAPFLPIHPETGYVMQVPVEERDIKAGSIVWTDPETGKRYKTSILNGGAKCQWKPDWALRWASFGVDYEMSGKDHIDNVKTSGKICKVLGVNPPEGFNYELFLDQNGEKISKSKGNGITIDEWLTYASPESLALYMFQKPKMAKKLHFDVIPKAVDEYYTYLSKYDENAPIYERIENPVWHIHSGNPPKVNMPVHFSMLLNLVSASHANDKEALWSYISQHTPEANAKTCPELDKLCEYAISYYKDKVEPFRQFKEPDDIEIEALARLKEELLLIQDENDPEKIQEKVLWAGRQFPRYHDLKKIMPDGIPGVTVEWFNMLYKVLLGQEKGPRFGSFVSLYGIDKVVELIDSVLNKKLENKM